MKYQYPIDPDWTTDEIITIVQFFEQVERAYETKVNREELLQRYREFKRIVPSTREEKHIFKRFKQISTYDSYFAVKKAQESHVKEISM